MELKNGLDCWESAMDKESFLEMCEPFTDVPSDAKEFVAWIGKVVRSHMQDKDKQLLAIFLSLLLAELAPEYALAEGMTHGIFPDRFIGDAGSTSHVVSGLVGKGGYTGFFH